MSVTVKKNQMYKPPAPTGQDQTPIVRNVVGIGGQYGQSWKSANGENWLDRQGTGPKTNAVDEAFFRRSKG